MWDLEVDVRRRLAVAAGASPAAVPPQRVRGGIGDSHGFDRRAHLQQVISYGTPPVKWCRHLVLRDLDAGTDEAVA